MTSRFRITLCLLASLLMMPLASRAEDAKAAAKPVSAEKAAEAPAPADVTTEGQVRVGEKHITYSAVAGTIVVGATDEQDGQLGLDGKPLPGSGHASGGPNVLRRLLPERLDGRGPAPYVLF
jgi:hypothetical protein